MNTGSLLGTVKDPTGAGVPEAKVTIQRTDTPFERQVLTDANGDFLVPQAPVGRYQYLTVFKRQADGSWKAVEDMISSDGQTPAKQ